MDWDIEHQSLQHKPLPPQSNHRPSEMDPALLFRVIGGITGNAWGHFTIALVIEGCGTDTYLQVSMTCRLAYLILYSGME
jgi:hypothetical protein